MTDPAIDSEKNNSIAPVEAETAWDLYYKIRTINDTDATIASNLASCISTRKIDRPDVFGLAQRPHAWSADAEPGLVYRYLQARVTEANSSNTGFTAPIRTTVDDGTVFNLKRATPERPSRGDGETSSAEGLSTAPYEKELVNDGPRKARDANSESDADAGLKPGRILSANSTESDAGRTGSDTSRLDGSSNIPQTFEGIERRHEDEKRRARDKTMAFGSDGQPGDLRRTRGSQPEHQRTWLGWLSRGSTRK